MEHKQKYVKQALELLRQSSGLEWSDEGQNSYEEIVNFKAERIDYMLIHEPNTLMNAFYRVDLNEHKVREIMSAAELENIPRHLAELVLNRMIEKVYWREKIKREGL